MEKSKPQIKWQGKVYLDTPAKNGWSHLVADNLETLHTFAQEVGLPKSRFHNPRGKNKPHYDVKHYEVDNVLDYGACMVDKKSIINF